MVQGDVPESCNGRDDDCNGHIDEGDVCPICPYGMLLIEGVPGIPSRICIDKYSGFTSTNGPFISLITIQVEIEMI